MQIGQYVFVIKKVGSIINDRIFKQRP